MIKRTWYLATVFMVLLMAITPLWGCSGGPATPQGEKEVIYLSLSDYTGPAAGATVKSDAATAEYMKYVNDKGGVDGVKIKFVGVDCRYDPARTLSAYKRYRTDPKILVINVLSGAACRLLLPLMKDDGMMGLCPGSGELVAMKDRFFAWGITYQNSFAASLDWMNQDWKAKGKSGVPKIGFIGWDTSYGHETYEMGPKQYAEQKGYSLVAPEYTPTTTLKYDVYLKRLADAGANYIYLELVDPIPAAVMRDAKAMGLTKDITFMLSPFGTTMQGVKLSPEAMEGVIVAAFTVKGDDCEKITIADEICRKYQGKPIKELDWADTYASSLFWGMDFEAGLKIALKDAGGFDKVNGNYMYAAYQKLTDSNHRQGITGPCSWSQTQRQACDQLKIYTVAGGKFTSLTNWAKVPDTTNLVKWK